MAIRHKRKNSTGYTWASGDLVDGQIGINTADGTLHIKKSDDEVVTIPNDSAIAGKADAVDPSLSGTITLADSTKITGTLATASTSPYFQSSTGNDTYLRVRANGNTSTSIAGQFLYGSNDMDNCVQILLRARGNNSATASSGIIWQKTTGGVVGAPPEFQFVSHNGTGYNVPYAMTNDGSTTNSNHIVTKGYADATYGNPININTDYSTYDFRTLDIQPGISGSGISTQSTVNLYNGAFGEQQFNASFSANYDAGFDYNYINFITTSYDATGTPIDPLGDFVIKQVGASDAVNIIGMRAGGEISVASAANKIVIGETFDLASSDGQVIFNGHLPPAFDGTNIDYTDITDGNHIINRDYLNLHIGIQSTQDLTIGSDTLEFNNLSFDPKVAGKDIYDSSIWLHSDHVSNPDRHRIAIACDTMTTGQQAIFGLVKMNGTSAEDSDIPIIISNQGGGEIWVGQSGADIQMKNVSVDLQEPPIFPRYTLSTLPTARLGAVIIVTDANSGAGTVCFGNGTNFIDIKTGTTVA